MPHAFVVHSCNNLLGTGQTLTFTVETPQIALSKLSISYVAVMKKNRPLVSESHVMTVTIQSLSPVPVIRRYLETDTDFRVQSMVSACLSRQVADIEGYAGTWGGMDGRPVCVFDSPAKTVLGLLSVVVAFPFAKGATTISDSDIDQVLIAFQTD